MTYEQWLDSVDQSVKEQVGVSIHDLTDFRFRDAFDDGCKPESTAQDVIANDQEYSCWD